MPKKVAVLTGATGGIGRALVKELDSEGFICVLVGRHENELKNLTKTLKTTAGKIYISDFTNINDVAKVSKQIAKDYSVVDVLLNIAGIGVYKPIEEVTLKDWEDSFTIGNTAPYFITQTLLPNLTKSQLSLVINIGSGMGIIPTAGRSVYCSMKFALRGQTLSLAEEFKRTKPHFVLLSLGSILTPFGPMSMNKKREEMESGKGYLTPDWVAKKTIEIINDEKREVEYTLYPTDYAPK